MEKTGNTVKLELPFETASNLEVYMVRLKDWYRVTSRDFRSFVGDRRINFEPYHGPVYAFNTNKVINPNQYEWGSIAEMKWESKQRQNGI